MADVGANNWNHKDWVIVTQLGKGGQGEVFLVVKKDASKTLAHLVWGEDYLGALKRPTGDREHSNSRFREEVETLQKIRHPNHLKILERCPEKNPTFYISEFHRFGSMDSYFTGKPYTITDTDLFKGDLRRAILFLIPLIGVITKYHENGVIHRDIKPGNILIGKYGQPILTDPGLARNCTRKPITAEGDHPGNWEYAPPWLGQVSVDGGLDYKHDIFSLVKLLWVMVSGKLQHSPNSHFKSADWDNEINLPVLENAFNDEVSLRCAKAIFSKCIHSVPGKIEIDSASALEDLVRDVLVIERYFGQLGGACTNCLNPAFTKYDKYIRNGSGPLKCIQRPKVVDLQHASRLEAVMWCRICGVIQKRLLPITIVQRINHSIKTLDLFDLVDPLPELWDKAEIVTKELEGPSTSPDDPEVPDESP